LNWPIYKWILADKKQGGEWYKYLRHNNKKYHKRGHKKKKRSIIPDRVCISQRPTPAEEKGEIGHLEMDLIEGKKGTGFIISMVDRKAKYTTLQKVMTKEAHEVRCGIQDKLMPLKGIIKTKPYDNGREFTNHKMAGDALGVESYFARPYCSWQRGLNEHTNGLVRQFIPQRNELYKDYGCRYSEGRRFIEQPFSKDSRIQTPSRCLFQ
jgi:transposase, IS30 family